MFKTRYVLIGTLAGVLSATAPPGALAGGQHDHGKSFWDFDFDFSDWFNGWNAFSGPLRSAAPFKWTGSVAAGKKIEIRGVNGSIRATPTSGKDVEVVALRSGRRNDPESVKIEVVPHADGVTICAVYPSRSSRPNSCEPGGGHMNVRNNDVGVEFEVRVPRNVNFEGRTVNGTIRADVDGQVALSTVNGSIEVEAGTVREATTVNGSIRASVESASLRLAEMSLRTVNGSVRLSLPEGMDLDVSARTVNGGITSEFDEIEVRRKWGPRSAEGRLGQGGPELALATVNGAIRITRLEPGLKDNRSRR